MNREVQEVQEGGRFRREGGRFRRVGGRFRREGGRIMSVNLSTE